VVLGAAQVGFADRTSGARLDRAITVATDPTEDAFSLDWESSEDMDITLDELEKVPEAGGSFAEIPAAASASKSYTAWKKDLVTWLYGTQTSELLTSPALKQTAKPGESERDFRLRLSQTARELRDAKMEKLREKYDKKVASLQDKILRAEQAVEREADQQKQQKMSTAISFGAGLLGGFLGGRRSSMGRMATGMRGVGRGRKEAKDVDRAKERLMALRERLEQLEEDFREDSEQIAEQFDPDNAELEHVIIRPKKKDIRVRMLALAWLPHWQSTDGRDVSPAY
jgi:hypothetical protein